jgi:hypothetical protein
MPWLMGVIIENPEPARFLGRSISYSTALNSLQVKSLIKIGSASRSINVVILISFEKYHSLTN